MAERRFFDWALPVNTRPRLRLARVRSKERGTIGCNGGRDLTFLKLSVVRAAQLILTVLQKMTTKRPSDDELSGMSVNERLFACGLLDAWDEAVMNRDRPQMIALLLQTAIARDQAERTTDAVLENPKTYGF